MPEQSIKGLTDELRARVFRSLDNPPVGLDLYHNFFIHRKWAKNVAYSLCSLDGDFEEVRSEYIVPYVKEWAVNKLREE